MAQVAEQGPLAAFGDIVKHGEPLAPYTYFKLGGPAEMLVQPRTRQELAGVLQTCRRDKIPLRVLGSGCNILVRDEGVRGVVLRLSEPAFTHITVEGTRVKAGAGATLAALISQAARHGLGGLETLVGIAGTVGGAIRRNAGDRTGEIGQYVRRVEVLDEHGKEQVRERDELDFGYRGSSIDDPVLLAAEFDLETDSPDAIVKRMRKAWITRKASQPLSFQAAVKVFKNPRGQAAGTLIDEVGLAQTKVGGAEISDREASYVLAHPGATARDVLRLIDLVRTRVRERFHLDLELEVSVW